MGSLASNIEMNFHSILALLRIELGQIFRERSRFRLIGLLIAIPVACLVCLGTIVNLVEPTSDELVRHSLGSADIAIEGVDPQDRLLLAKQLIGADSLCARIYRGNDEISIPGRTLAVSVIAIDTNEGDGLGIANGMLTLQGGRLPRSRRHAQAVRIDVQVQPRGAQQAHRGLPRNDADDCLS